MIYVPGRCLFIHIPRTAGTSIKTAFIRHVNPLSGYMVQMTDMPYRFRRHARAAELAVIVSNWFRITRFAIIRNPWTALPSMYRYWHALADKHKGNLKTIGSKLRNQIELVLENTFAEWVPKHCRYLEPGQGHWHHFCLSATGEPLGVKAYKFEELDKWWSEIAELLRIPTDTPLPKLNQGKDVPTEWTDESVAWVRQHFSDDISRFDYPREP